jgi:TPR repeat protein
LGEAIEKGALPAGGLEPFLLFQQAAAAGHGPAALRLGQLYLGGGPLPRDEARAAMWLALAAEARQTEASLTLGRLYYDKNPAAAAKWLEQARNQEAGYLLGELYLKEKRFIEAVAAFTFAADQGSPEASLALGLLNLDNEFGRRPNPREALRRFKIAAQAGLPNGAYHLAHMYIAGQATPKDSLTGAFWLHRAADRGHEEARAEYDKLTLNFTPGQKKRLERMIEDGFAPAAGTPADQRP